MMISLRRMCVFSLIVIALGLNWPAQAASAASAPTPAALPAADLAGLQAQIEQAAAPASAAWPTAPIATLRYANLDADAWFGR